MDNTRALQNVTVSAGERSCLTIKALVPRPLLDEARRRVLKRHRETLAVKGFRKGHVPEAVVREHVGEGTLDSEALAEALNRVLPELMAEHAPRAIAQPALKSVAEQKEGTEVVLSVPVLPEVSLPDYRALAKEAVKKAEDPEKAEVSDEEVASALKEHLRAYQKEVRRQLGGAEAPEVKDGDIPELTDALAKQLGPFAGAEDLKKRLRESMQVQKKQSLHEKRRMTILTAILDKTTVAVPEVIIEGELADMWREFEATLARAGLTAERYLTEAKKTREQVAGEWRPEAEKRAILQLVLAEIAGRERIEPDRERLERELAHARQEVKDIDEDRARAFLSHRLSNEAVLQFLETGQA